MSHIFRTIPIIGMSPWNSYFKDDEIRHLLSEVLKKFGYAVVFIADIPAIKTYQALGYTEKRAREKAVLKGNNLKNKVIRACKDIGIQNDIVRIIDWKLEVEENLEYLKSFHAIETLFNTNEQFRASVLSTTKSVLINSGRNTENIEKAAELGSFYLLSELAFLDLAPKFLECERVSYIYHRLWWVYEDYLAGKFDTIQKPHLAFHLIEAPHEYYESTLFADQLDLIETRKELFAGFIDYRYALYSENGEYKGFYYELLNEICTLNGWKLLLTGRTNYATAIQGLNERRFDIYASPTWTTEERLRKALFSDTTHMSPAYVWIREDTLFDPFQNQWSLRMAVLETDITDMLGGIHFPLAIKRYFSWLHRIEDLLHSVENGETDFTICEDMTYQSYLNEGGRPLKKAFPMPIATFNNCFMLRKWENRLQERINSTLHELEDRGYIDKIREKHLQYTKSD